MRIFLSYAKSHIYEIHAMIAATIAFLSMFIVKKPMKEHISNFVARKATKNGKWEEHRKLYTRRCNIIIIVFTMLLSCFLFLIISIISPLIQFSMFSAVLSGTIALTEYAVYDQFVSKKGARNE